MIDEKEEETIEESLMQVEESSTRLSAFIDGLEAAACLMGLDRDTRYPITKLSAAASNIHCYCGRIRQLLQEKNKPTATQNQKGEMNEIN